MPTQAIASVKNRFLYIESHQIPLTEIPYDEIKVNIIDPITKKPYKGIVLEGCFADLSNDELNNNKRFYDVPTYLEFVKILRKQIHSPKGVYGELEHPKRYNVDYNFISHKLLDIWYDENQKKVFGRIILLQTERGRAAEEVIRSGGQLAISARAAGDEIQNPDGSFKAILKLLVTFDLVYHPGFNAALLNFKELNENQKIGFAGLVYETELEKMPTTYAKYSNLNESSNNCFFEWYFRNQKNLNESEKSQNKEDEEILQENKNPDQEKFEDKLETATQNDLSEKQKFFQQVNFSQQRIKKQIVNRKNNSQNKSYYDNSAGFINLNQEDEDL
jgi:hypothetical protein